MGRTTSLDDYFSADYFEAQKRFRYAIKTSGGQLHTLAIDAKGPNGEALTIDIGWFGAERPKRVLLHSSGIHGVEGFAGSAIQLFLLTETPRLAPDAALVFVHILNPYGMAWLRRVNENNVDLNRNFLNDGEFRGAPPAYLKIDSFLNPQSPPANDHFMLKAMWLIMRYGFTTLKQAIAGGQYEFPKGLFFGGKRLQQGPEKYRDFLQERLASAEQVVAIDIHTGLGKFGEDILLVLPKEYKLLRERFGDRVVALEPAHGEAWDARGASHNVLSSALPQAQTFFLAQEFGTVKPVKVLHALREENRWHQYGAGTIDHETKRELKEAFCPNKDGWRLRVLERGNELFSQASKVLSADN